MTTPPWLTLVEQDGGTVVSLPTRPRLWLAVDNTLSDEGDFPSDSPFNPDEAA